MAAMPAIVLAYPSLLALLATNSNYTIFANDHGVSYVVDVSEPILTTMDIKEIMSTAEKTTFYLYTRKNPIDGQELFIDNLESVRNSFWDPEHPTTLITHGWQGSADSEACTLVLDAYLEAVDYNVILIDWRDAAGSLLYWRSANSVPHVANRVALLLNFLEKSAGLNRNKTKLIGHSLGAHVSSLAARAANGDIAEVVALDPAKPMFSGKQPGDRVDETDALLVHVIHTHAGGLGIEEAIGTADFYPNGGTNQPGCSTSIIGACAHSRSYMYYAESIMNPKGFRAENVYMGGPVLDPRASGKYTLQTADKSPFALG